jgi:hypothetical protein
MSAALGLALAFSLPVAAVAMIFSSPFQRLVNPEGAE